MKSSKLALIIFITFFIKSVYGQSDTIKYWSKVDTLKWSDFQGPVNAKSSFDANTNSGLIYHWQVNFQGDSSKFSFTVNSFVNKHKSWVRTGFQKPRLLKHEQLHFDISEFFARKLLDDFNAYKYTSDYRNDIVKIFTRLQTSRQIMEDKYDEQSNHSLNAEWQQWWERYVAYLLQNNISYQKAMDGIPKK